jgi:ubiquinone/menaquinone biosynthesis C-methylase UbiE
MLSKVLTVPETLTFSRKFFWTHWYNLFASLFSEVNISFMNYGFAETNANSARLDLHSNDEVERYCLQLYHHVASSIALHDLDVLEVGCGRGGGSSFVKRYLNPKSMTGVDISDNNIDLCRNKYSIPQLSFKQGDAESLTFDDSCFDVVINVESSHCYPNIINFFAESFRVLRPNGYFLYADFRPRQQIDNLLNQLKTVGFELIKQELITENVLASMNLENDRKAKIIQSSIPKILHGLTSTFSGIAGTHYYQGFKNKDYEYFFYILQKK